MKFKPHTRSLLAKDKVDSLLLLAERIVWIKINAEIISILTAKDNPATTFVCAMGGWSFYDSAQEPLDDTDEYGTVLYSIFDEYNQVFKLTGAGFRWDLVDGKVISNYQNIFWGDS